MNANLQGETPQQIAIALKVNLRYLYRLLNEAKKTADPEQIDFWKRGIKSTKAGVI